MHQLWWVMALGTCWITGSEPSRLDQTAPGGATLRILLSDPLLLNQLSVTDSSVALYASAADKQANKPEIVVYQDEFARMASLIHTLEDSALMRLYQTKGKKRLSEIRPDSMPLSGTLTRAKATHRQPLAGVRIALDPGHLAGTFAEAESLEYRFMKVRPNPADTTVEYRFYEADLALKTALLLQRWLEADGATVFLTRSKPGISVFGISFAQWEKDSLPVILKRLSPAQRKYYTTEATRTQVYQNLFVNLDLRARADSINAFHPDLTLVLHYNVHLNDVKDRTATGYSRAGEENYHMAFVPGSFMRNELDRPEDRLALLRMLLTDDVIRSIRLSDGVCEAFCGLADIPPAGLKEGGLLAYLGKASQPTREEGVYARNLSLTRLIRGPICYGEPLCQNNLREAEALAKSDYEEGDIVTSRRVAAIARAYYAGVRAYLGE